MKHLCVQKFCVKELCKKHVCERVVRERVVCDKIVCVCVTPFCFLFPPCPSHVHSCFVFLENVICGVIRSFD